MTEILKSKETEIEDGSLVRIGIIAASVAVVFSILMIRLWFLQVVSGESYKKMAEENRVRTVSIQAPRGLIFDRNHQLLAVNRLALTLTVLPTNSKDNALINRLSALLNMPVSDINKQIESKRIDPLKPRVIKRDLTPEIVAYIKEHQDDFPGVEIVDEPIRDYPNGSLASHILGYIGEVSEAEMKQKDFSGYELGDLVGKSGVEKQYENVLKGTKGVEYLEVNAANKPIRTLRREEPDPGNNLVLTIDNKIQASAEKALAEAIAQAKKQKFPNANAGAIVVMDPKNGEIIAMASYPTFDPRIFIGGISSGQWQALNDKNGGYPLTNRAMMSGYPSGSTFKVVTALAGLRTGVITPSTTFFCAGRWTFPNSRSAMWCWDKAGHGIENLAGALTESCDVYFYNVGYALYRRGQEELQLWARKMGLGSKTGIDLPGETAGLIPDKAWKKAFNKTWPANQSWFPGDTVNMSIGQGDVLLSPLQLATVYSAIANDGLIYQPHVVKAVMTTDGKAASEPMRNKPRRIDIPAADFEAVKEGLKKVTTSPKGTAAGAFRGFPIPVAGKTGTSEMAGKDNYAFFSSFAPADDPKYVIAVVIEQGGHGGSAAAPAARAVFNDIYGLSSAVGNVAADSSR